MVLEGCTKSLALTLTLTLTLLAPLVMGGCAGMKAHNAHVEAETKQYVFDEDPSTVLATAREILFAQGYQVVDSGPNALETDWRVRREGKRRSRMLVQVAPSGSGTKLSAMGWAEALSSKGEWYGGSGSYDADFALQVIERLDAETAERIHAGAQAAKEEAQEKRPRS